jgi:uncharacterized protein (DUF1684 family)
MTPRAVLSMGLIIILLALSTEGAMQKDTLTPDAAHQEDIGKWRQKRVEELTGESGWLSLVGLFWLKQGQNRFGSAPSNEIVLPRNRAPRLAGSLWLSKGVVRLKAKPEASVTSNGSRATKLVLESDADGNQTVLKLGSLTFYVIKRGERLGVRVKDSQNPARSRFTGLKYFPVDPRWKLEAKYEPHAPPKMIPILNVLGMVEEMPSPGTLVFKLDGKTYRLEPVLEKGEKEWFIIFGDKTTGKETYGAGRYLYADPPDSQGRVTLDFNKSYNPPCAFTKFATCPLPPRQNRLPFRVEAGEKKYARSEH